jgi:hypothetical protein
MTNPATARVKTTNTTIDANFKFIEKPLNVAPFPRKLPRLDLNLPQNAGWD